MILTWKKCTWAIILTLSVSSLLAQQIDFLLSFRTPDSKDHIKQFVHKNCSKSVGGNHPEYRMFFRSKFDKNKRIVVEWKGLFDPGPRLKLTIRYFNGYNSNVNKEVVKKILINNGGNYEFCVDCSSASMREKNPLTFDFISDYQVTYPHESSATIHTNSGKDNLEFYRSISDLISQVNALLNKKHNDYQAFEQEYLRLSEKKKELEAKINDDPDITGHPDYSSLEGKMDEAKAWKHYLYTQKDKSSSASPSSTLPREAETTITEAKPPNPTSSKDSETEKENKKEEPKKRDFRKLQKNYNNLKDDFEQLKDKASTLETENQRKDGEIKTLNLTIDRLRNEKDNLEQRLSETEKQNQGLLVRINQASKGIALASLIEYFPEPEAYKSLLKLADIDYEFVTVRSDEAKTNGFRYGISDKEYEDLIRAGGGVHYDNEITKAGFEKRYIPTHYLIGKYEVTNKQYQQIVPSHTFPEGEANKPVVNLTYREMMEYCRALSLQLGFDRGVELSLPMEWEWEFAVRGSEGKYYPWGNNLSGSSSEYANTRGRNLLNVGSYEDGKSWCGAYDMIGNAYEACIIDRSSYKSDISNEVIAARGGSFKTNLLSSRATSRYTLFGATGREDLGFRMVVRLKR